MVFFFFFLSSLRGPLTERLALVVQRLGEVWMSRSEHLYLFSAYKDVTS